LYFASAALGLVYGKNVLYQNPVYKSIKVEGNKIRIRFENTAAGIPGQTIRKDCLFRRFGLNLKI